jgi:hypothetical protein
MHCVDDTTELVADPDGSELLCWGDRCLRRPFRGRQVTRPAASSEPRPVVGPDQVCTGSRCDRFGPNLRAELERVSPEYRAATQDHATIALTWGGPVWDRASDRVILDGLDAARIEVLGNRLAAVTEPDRRSGFCSSASASLVDADGRARGEAFPIRSDGVAGVSTFAFDQERFLVFGSAGEITLIDHGHVDASSELVAVESGDHVHVQVRAVVRIGAAVDGDRAAILWCEGDDCYVTEVFAGGGRAKEQGALELGDDTMLPLCDT